MGRWREWHDAPLRRSRVGAGGCDHRDAELRLGFCPDDVWAVGSTVIHWDGVGWSTVDFSPFPVSSVFIDRLTSIWGSSSGEVLMVGARGILGGKPGQWRVPTQVTEEHLGASWFGSASDIWVGGTNGTLIHWDGMKWSPTASGTTEVVTSLWGSSSDQVWGRWNERDRCSLGRSLLVECSTGYFKHSLASLGNGPNECLGCWGLRYGAAMEWDSMVFAAQRCERKHRCGSWQRSERRLVGGGSGNDAPLEWQHAECRRQRNELRVEGCLGIRTQRRGSGRSGHHSPLERDAVERLSDGFGEGLDRRVRHQHQ